MKFTKMHGCGNDYIYINCFQEKVSDESRLAVTLSDRHFGIGSDGLVLIKPSDVADFEMVMYNPDGSRGAMCGNAARCIAKYVWDNHLTNKKNISIVSMGAIKYIEIETNDEGKAVSARVDMGAPIFETKLIPANFDDEKVINKPITIGGKEFKTTLVSMGNPHAVSFIESDPNTFDLEHFGPLFEGNTALFPDRINAEFARVDDNENITMRVYERGTGETLACGTGTCATVAAAIVNGYTGHNVTVHLRGGDLKIEWDGNPTSSIFMTGPATTVYTGEIDI